MNNYKKGICFILATAIITIALLFPVSKVINRKDSYQKNHDFFTADTNYDVLFFGSSHMLNAIYPMELWEEYGIKSYNMAGHGCRIPTSYWIMKNTFEYSIPEVVVIDGYFLSHNDKTDSSKEFLHISFDEFPLTTTKISAIYDLIDEDKASFIFPFSTYHNRWSELNSEDFNFKTSTEKGASIRVGYTDGKKVDINQNVDEELITVGVTYLEKMITECLDKNIQVILTYLPFNIPNWAEQEIQALYRIAEKYNIPYLSYDELSDTINYKTDLADDGHLNYSGGSKITHYIGNYLAKNYFESNTNIAVKDLNWDNNLIEYNNYKLKLIEETNQVTRAISLLDNSATNSIIFFNTSKSSEIIKNLQIFFEDINLNTSEDCVILYKDNINNTLTPLKINSICDSSIGKIEINNTNNVYTIFVNDTKIDSIDITSDFSIIVKFFNKTDNELIFSTAYNGKGYN